MDISKTQFFLHLRPVERPEPPVTDAEHIVFFVEQGCWLRAVAAEQLHRTLVDPKVHGLSRFAAVASLYQIAGVHFEDTVARLVAFAAWHHVGRSELLSDIIERTFPKTYKAKAGEEIGYLDALLKEFEKKGSTKRVAVHPKLFIASLASLEPRQLIKTLGIPWKPIPSVKVVPAKRREEWQSLPERMHAFVRDLSDNVRDLVTLGYNKLKHGPQIIAISPDEALRRRGATEEERKGICPTEPCLRLLFHGARTQESEAELIAGDRVAPFLLHDAHFIDKIVWDVIVRNSLELSDIGYWLLRSHFAPAREPTIDPSLEDLLLYYHRRGKSLGR